MPTAVPFEPYPVVRFREVDSFEGVNSELRELARVIETLRDEGLIHFNGSFEVVAGTIFLKSVQIQDASIVTAKIGLLQVTNALLAADINADKITTGILIADRIEAGSIVAAKFTTDLGVDLLAVVPGSLSWKRTTLDSTSFAPPLEPLWSADKIVSTSGDIGGHKAIIRINADHKTDLAANQFKYNAELRRRVDSGSWSTIHAFQKITLSTTFVAAAEVEHEDFSPPTGSVEYSMRYQRSTTSATTGQLDEVETMIEAIFFK